MPTLTPLAHLTAARALLAPGPERWTQGAAVRYANGDRRCAIIDAVCFCSLGALWRAGGRDYYSDAERILFETVLETTRFSNIVSFNDAPETTYADVLRVYDLAIAAAGEAV